MVAGNIIFIFGIKIRDLYYETIENNRIKRLRWISEVEQKYLFLDYRKFFLQGTDRFILEDLAKGYHLKNKRTEERIQLKPTELF
jgi:hypothetical protein